MSTYTHEQHLFENNVNSCDKDMPDIFKEKARELFALCDKEEKGFATKRDLYRLQSELHLSPKQLGEVFDTLDRDGNEYLTLDEFAEGLGFFLGIDNHLLHTENNNISVETSEIQDEHAESEQFEDFLDNLGANSMFKNEDLIKEMWDKMRRDNPESLDDFEGFLAKITEEFRATQMEYSSLETTLERRKNLHDEQVQALYAEMEEQLQAEKDLLLRKERLKEEKIRDELEAELQLKDHQLRDLCSKHAEMAKRLTEINVGDSETKHENIKLQKERDGLEIQLEASEKILQDMQSQMDLLRKKSIDEKRMRAKAALKVSEDIALEREDLVKQLQELKKANQQLLDEKDELVHSGCCTPATSSDDEPMTPLQADNVRFKPLRRSGKRYSSRKDKLKRTKAMEKKSTSDDNDGDIKEANIEHPSTRLHNDPLRNQSETSQEDNQIVSDTEDTNLPTPDALKSIEDDCEVDDQFFENDPRFMSPWAKSELIKQNNLNLVHSKKPKRSNILQNNLIPDISEDADDLHKPEETSSKVKDKTCSSVGDSAVQSKNVTNVVGNNTHIVKSNEKAVTGDSPTRLFKVVFIGDSGVGKTCFIHRFCNDTFRPTFSATIGVDFQIKGVCVDGRPVALQIWDTAGQERFRSMTSQFFRKADGVVILYDVTSEISFKNVRNWISQVHESTDENTVILLIGNKVDLCENDSDRVITAKHGNHLADECGALFYETSAKTGTSVEEAMEALTRMLQDKEDKIMEMVLKLHQAEATKKKKKCC